MNLSKLPPFVAASLGLLGCITAEPCLSLGPPETDSITGTGTGTGTGTSSGSATEPTDVGPCLSQPPDTSSGPCLGVPMDSSSGTSSGSDSGSSSGFESGSGSESGSESGTSSGGMFDEPTPPTSRAAAVERVLSRGNLPADVLDRLRMIIAGTKG